MQYSAFKKFVNSSNQVVPMGIYEDGSEVYCEVYKIGEEPVFLIENSEEETVTRNLVYGTPSEGVLSAEGVIDTTIENIRS